MVEASEITQQSSESVNLRKQPATSLQDTEVDQLNLLMNQTRRCYQQQSISQGTVEVWFPAWIALAIRYGLPSLRKALRAHMLESRWFPLPADLRERLDAMNPPKPYVYVPMTRRERANLVGAEAAGTSQMSVEEVASIHGPQSAGLYRAKL